MKLYIRQKVFTLTHRFTIKDETGVDRYTVEGELFSFRHKMHLYNQQGQEVALIQRRLWSFLPRFEVYVRGQLAVEVVKEFTFLRQRYLLRRVNWQVEGDFWAHHYTIFDHRGVIATIQKAWFSWGDSYELDISPAADEILAIATVLAIDCATESSNQ